jgi:hypothetical protein
LDSRYQRDDELAVPTQHVHEVRLNTPAKRIGVYLSDPGKISRRLRSERDGNAAFFARLHVERGA